MKNEKQGTYGRVLFNQNHVKTNPHARWLNRAIRSNRWGKDNHVLITYKKEDGSISERRVKPISAKKHLLIAHDHTRNAIRSFHIERIQSMEKNAFFKGFEKNAGAFQRLLDKLRYARTGKIRIYHGTTPERAKLIREIGLKPQARPGITQAVSENLTKANAGLVFGTIDKDVAKAYSRQQIGLEHAPAIIKKTKDTIEGVSNKIPESFKRRLPHGVRSRLHYAKNKSLEFLNRKETPTIIGRLAAKFPIKPAVVTIEGSKAQLPKRVLNPERKEIGGLVARMSGDISSKPVKNVVPGKTGRAVAKEIGRQSNPYAYDYVMRGEVSPELIKK